MAVLEAGACDTLSKPVEVQPLLHKIRLCIQNRHKQLLFEPERANLQSLAMGFLSSLGQSGILMNFVRASICWKSYEELAERLMEAVRELGIDRVARQTSPFRVGKDSATAGGGSMPP